MVCELHKQCLGVGSDSNSSFIVSNIVEETLDGLSAFLFRRVKPGIDDLLPEEFPKLLNKIEVLRVR